MLESVAQVIEGGRQAGHHAGAQLHAARHGRVIVDEAFGEAQTGTAMRADHLLPWFSAGKPITAVAIAQQWERGALDLDDPVADHLPAFAQHGKAAITIRHILTHTAGFRAEPYRFAEDDWDTIIQKLCAQRLEPRWVPGEKAGYHPLSSWFVLAEIVRRASGEPFWRYVRRHIFEPCGMHDSWIGMPEAQLETYVNEGRWAVMYDTADSPATPRLGDDNAHVVRPKPGGNACGPVRELGRFYQMLLSGGTIDGEMILQRDTVDQLTSPQRVGLHDHTFKQPITWGLGFILDSKAQVDGTPAYGYGPHASTRAFGHGGVQSSVGFADPAHGLVVAIAFNGMPGEQAHQQRMEATLSALYEDLALV